MKSIMAYLKKQLVMNIVVKYILIVDVVRLADALNASPTYVANPK